jgi:hypothetical protein
MELKKLQLQYKVEDCRISIRLVNEAGVVLDVAMKHKCIKL